MAPRLTGTANRIAGEFFGYDPANTEESESVLAKYFPELKLSFGAKSIRGSRLGRAPQTAQSEVKIGPAPQGAAPQPTGGGEAPAPINQTIQFQAQDTSGLQAQLANIQRTLAEANKPKEPVKAPEYTPEQETIKGYYEQYLGRTPQKSEIADWQGTGKTLAEIQTGLKEHPTSLKSTQEIGSYYQQFLGRPAQASEIKDWQGTGKSMEEIKQGLIGYAQQQSSGGSSAPAYSAPSYSAPAAYQPHPLDNYRLIV